MLEGVGEYRDHERYLQRSYEVTETLETMVKEILTISRMGTGTWKTERKKTDLAELFRQEMAEVWELLEEKEMELTGEIPEHAYALADSEGMKKSSGTSHQCDPLSPKGAKLTVCFQENGFSLENEGRPFRRKPCRSFLKLFTGWKIPETGNPEEAAWGSTLSG